MFIRGKLGQNLSREDLIQQVTNLYSDVVVPATNPFSASGVYQSNTF